MDYVELIGLVAGFCTTISFLPQAIKAWKTKKTKDLSLGLFSFFTFGVILWLIYGILIESLPVTIWNAVTLILAGSILVMKLRYG